MFFYISFYFFTFLLCADLRVQQSTVKPISLKYYRE